MFARSDLGGWLADFLGEHADEPLRQAGFVRRARARSARRPVDQGSQQIQFFVASRPPYAPDLAHLYLSVALHRPELMDLTRRIFAADEGTLACGAALDSLPGAPARMWLFQDRAGLDDLSATVRQALTGCVLPFLDASRSLADLVDGPARDRTRVEVVAAAYVRLGRPTEAVDFFRARREVALLSPQAREAHQRRHAEALARLERYLAETPIV